MGVSKALRLPELDPLSRVAPWRPPAKIACYRDYSAWAIILFPAWHFQWCPSILLPELASLGGDGPSPLTCPLYSLLPQDTSHLCLHGLVTVTAICDREREADA